MIRASVVFIVIGLLGAGVLYDRVDPPARTEAATIDDAIVTPSMSDPPRLDGAWFCPLGSSNPEGFADHTIEVSNLGEDDAAASVGVLTAAGRISTLNLELAPLSTQSVALSSIASEEVAGAVVEIVAGVGVVSHTVQTSQGPATGPCATHISDSWFFAGGRTHRDSEEYIALMNPFPEDAIFNVELYRSAGRPRQPGELQGGVVPGSSVKVIRVDSFIDREDYVAASISTVSGRLVAERLQTINGDLGPSGAALQLGVPDPAESWMLPAGRITDGGGDRVIAFNPSAEDTATVDIELWPLNPTDRSLYGLGPIPRELLPGRFEVIDLRVEADRFGLRLPYEVGVSVTSNNEVPIVVERWHYAVDIAAEAGEGDAAGEAEDPAGEGEDPTAEEGAAVDEEVAGEEQAAAEGEEPGDEPLPGDQVGELDIPGILGGAAQDLAQPSPDIGIATSRGTEVLSQRWVFPWIPTPTPESAVVIVTAPQDANVEVTALVNGEMQGPYRETVLAGGRAIVPLPINAGGAPVVVESDAPVSADVQVVVLGSSFATIAGAPTIAR